jgi:pyruvate/2-oxoglutarate dehydrogenase complex dihydrolipoamide dehydrogenase (E3) component
MASTPSAIEARASRQNAKEFDVIVIGAGQSGGPLSTALAKAGRKVAIIEREHVGGSCVNVGCTPTKTMVASARVAHVVGRAADYGVHVGPARIELAEVRERKRKMVESFREGSVSSIEETEGVELIRGEAHFVDQEKGAEGFQLEVAFPDGAAQLLTAAQIFINVGTRTRLPDLPGLSQVAHLDHASLMELSDVPDHLLILGGGYIALEFSQMFRRFGSAVTIVQRGEQLLSREDADVAEAVTEILRDDGIEVLLEAEAQEVMQRPDGTIHLQVKLPDGTRSLVGTHLLIATGRTPNSDTLHLDKVGVTTDKKGHIEVNERLETNVPGIYVLGDAKGGPAFTHISYDDFRIARTNLLGEGGATTRNRIVPYTVFIDPELGRVGLSEEEAKRKGHNIRVAKLPMQKVARAKEVDETRGFMKAVVDADTKQILGCAILGIQGGEIATVLQVAMMGKLPYTAIQNAAFSHPTVAESINNLFTTLDL